jgi:hypothetical protein
MDINANGNSISVKSWQSVLLMKETREHCETPRKVTDKHYQVDIGRD